MSIRNLSLGWIKSSTAVVIPSGDFSFFPLVPRPLLGVSLPTPMVVLILLFVGRARKLPKPQRRKQRKIKKQQQLSRRLFVLLVCAPSESKGPSLVSEASNGETAVRISLVIRGLPQSGRRKKERRM